MLDNLKDMLTLIITLPKTPFRLDAGKIKVTVVSECIRPEVKTSFSCP